MIDLRKESCTGCGSCVRLCPHRVLELEDGVSVLAHEERCIECGACQLNCHDEAIEVTKGVGCLLAIIKEDILKLKDEKTAEACCG